MTKKQRTIKDNPRICHRCLKEKALVGKTECEVCNKINRDNNRKRRNKLKEKGLCRDCGVAPTTAGNSRCLACLKRSRIIAHGLTDKIYDAQMEKQEYLCAMCRKSFISGGKHVEAPCIDHVHGKCKDHDDSVACAQCFRSILHHGCNKALGILGDDPEAIIAYMKNLKKFAK